MLAPGLDVVQDDEELFHSVSCEDLALQADGSYVVSLHSFRDRNGQPSVDRKVIREDPAPTKQRPTDGVCLLVAKEIRELDDVTTAQSKADVVRHEIDVVADPVEGNVAHALVVANPAVKSSAKKRLQIALARLANARAWALVPACIQ